MIERIKQLWAWLVEWSTADIRSSVLHALACAAPVTVAWWVWELPGLYVMSGVMGGFYARREFLDLFKNIFKRDWAKVGDSWLDAGFPALTLLFIVNRVVSPLIITLIIVGILAVGETVYQLWLKKK